MAWPPYTWSIVATTFQHLWRIVSGGGKPTDDQTSAAAAAAPSVEKDEPMPDLADADIAFDNDKYRAKMQKWSRDQAKIAAREIVREMTGADEAQKRRAVGFPLRIDSKRQRTAAAESFKPAPPYSIAWPCDDRRVLGHLRLHR